MRRTPQSARRLSMNCETFWDTAARSLGRCRLSSAYPCPPARSRRVVRGLTPRPASRARGVPTAPMSPAQHDPPSGEQIELAHGAQRALVVEVGGALRAYAVDG